MCLPPRSRRRQCAQGHMHMIDDPLVKTLLTNKWRRFARAQWLLHGLLYLVLVLLQTFLVWLLGSASLFDTPARAVRVAAGRVPARGGLRRQGRRGRWRTAWPSPHTMLRSASVLRASCDEGNGVTCACDRGRRRSRS